MKDFLFTGDAFINLDNVAYVCAEKAPCQETHTKLIGPAFEITIAQPWPETKEMIEKLIKDRYEYEVKWYKLSAEQRRADLENMIDRFTNNHTCS